MYDIKYLFLGRPGRSGARDGSRRLPTGKRKASHAVSGQTLLDFAKGPDLEIANAQVR
jgi:hypothetical protein